jgi:hypothetical protein
VSCHASLHPVLIDGSMLGYTALTSDTWNTKLKK